LYDLIIAKYKLVKVFIFKQIKFFFELKN
jgi:hypothetical protein